MKHNKQQSHYVLDFSDIEDISDNESESSNKSNQQQQINQTTPTPNRIELQMPNLQVKKETVEIPSILIQEEEEPVIRRKLDFQNQQWQVNFDDLSEQDQQESDRSEVAIEIPRDPSPPTVAVEEPQYIEQYFEDQNVIEEIDIEQEQLKMEQRKEQLKQDLITKKQQQQKQIPKVQQVQKDQQQGQEINQQKNKNSEDKSKQVHKQKFYNPKNSLIYLRLKGREDLYKKQEYVIDEQTKPQDQDELLEGLECINNLLIGLSKIKDKKVGVVEKQQKILPLQIQKHRLDEKGDHHKESKLQKKDVKEKEKEKDNEQQKQNTKDAQKKDQQQTELNIKQQQLQEAQQARQIRHEKQQQEKEKQRLLEQRQVYKILTKKQVNQGLVLYKCLLRQKQKDSIKWLRYTEIALISKGESEIFNFEKRLSDQLFMQLHKANMRSVVMTKQAMFDVVTIHYVTEQKEVEEVKQKDKGQTGKNERENQIIEEKQIKEKKATQNNDKKKKNQEQQKNEVQQQKSDKQQQKGDKKQQKDKQLVQQQTQQMQQESEKDQQDAKRTKNKVSYLESDEEKKDEDLLDADSIQIFKVTQERQRKIDKKEKEKEQKQAQSNQQQVEEQKQIESNELNQKQINNQNKEQKKVKNIKIKECPLSRLETNDEIKKKEQINQKRKEKRRQEYQQYLNEMEQEQLVEVTHSKQKKLQKETKQQETNKQQNKSSNKGSKINNQQEIQNLEEQTNSKDKEETKQSNSTKRGGRQSTRNHKSPSPTKESIEPGYVSSKRIYENRDQKKKRLKVVEDEESEFSEQNVKQPQIKEQKKRVRQK